MYLEFLLITADYFKTINKRIFLYEWILPLSISLLSILFGGCIVSFGVFEKFKESSINILGVLLGFSIAVITIITTGSGKNLEEIKRKETNVSIGTKKISLYGLLLINFSYSVVVEVLLILFCLIMPLINKIIPFGFNLKLFSYSLMVFTVLHILLLTLRNITDFYLIITKR